jgi:abortive infection bacteriophage resistance protein
VSTNSGLPKYTKPWLSIKDQIEKLISRGLVVTDRGSAERFLWHLNYYRFSGYCLAFEDQRHSFCDGTTFEIVKAAYDFDVILRDLLTEALEVIEVDSRSVIAHIFGDRYGAFGHLDKDNFKPSFDHSSWLAHVRDEADRSSELFVEHFRNNYDGFPDLPCWIATEVMSFGSVSKMYGGLKDQCSTPIANRYNMQKGDFESTLHHLSYVRNVCAHHSRLWDRVWAITPRVPRSQYWQPPLVPERSRVFVTLLIICRILKRCSAIGSFAVNWRRRVNELMKNPPATGRALKQMGMPSDWYKHPYWV